MIKVKARFIGANSLGFVNNVIYDISITDQKIGDIGNIDNRMLRVETDTFKLRSACEYSSWQRLISNWELMSAKVGNSEEYLHNKIKEYLRERKINKVLNG